MNNGKLKDVTTKCLNRLSVECVDFQFCEDPFKHFILDNFLPIDMAENCIRGFPGLEDDIWEYTNDQGLEIKYRTKWDSEFDIPDGVVDLVRLLNSSIALKRFGEILGIPKLLPDPYFTGGGLNSMGRGGLLGVHIDGNYHDASGLNRRANAILFLNKEWREAWGGHFEAFDDQGHKSKKKVLPILNRLLVFETSDVSFHGIPTPIACPPNMIRKSIILYYYTKDPAANDRIKYKKPHSALWTERSLKDKDGYVDRDHY